MFQSSLSRLAWIAGIILASVSAAAAQAPACNGPGHERWAIKTSVPAGANLSTPTHVPFAEFVKISEPAGVQNRDPRYESVRMSDVIDGKYKEGQIVQTEGWLYLVMTETDDCDYHIQISDQPRTLTNPPLKSDNCIIVEVPRPDFAPSKDLQDRYTTIRNFVKTRLLANKEPSTNGSVMRSTVYVRVTGALFYDDAHLKADGGVEDRGRKGMSAKTLWEIHPIIDLQFAPKPQ